MPTNPSWTNAQRDEALGLLVHAELGRIGPIVEVGTPHRALRPALAMPADPGLRVLLDRREAAGDGDAFTALLRSAGTQVDARLVRMAMPGAPAARALSTVSGTAGGFAVTAKFEAAVAQAMDSTSTILAHATVVDTDTGADLFVPTVNDTSNEGVIADENATLATPTDPALGRAVLRSFYFTSGIVPVSYQLLQDAGFDFEAFLADLLGRRVGRAFEKYSLNGSGANEPAGLATPGVVTVARTGATGQTATVAPDDLRAVHHGVNAAYRVGPDGLPTARWFMNDGTLESVRNLKDGSGRPLYTPGGATEPAALDGFPIAVTDKMPSQAAGAVPILFGNMAAGVLVRRVRGSGLRVFNELYAANFRLGFEYVLRADLVVRDPAALRSYVNAAS